MASVQIPPWLNIDPIEPARIQVQANAQRNQRAAAELNAQIARERMQEDALQAAAALQARQQQAEQANALRQQELDQLAAYRQEESQRKQVEGAALERLRQQKYEQDAMTASQRLEGMQDYQKRVANGEDKMQAFAANAHKILYQHPEQVGKLFESMGEHGPLTEGTTAGGANYLTRGGRPYMIPQTALPGQEFEPSGVVDFGGGVSAFQVSPKHYQILTKPTPPVPLGKLTDADRNRLAELATETKQIQKGLPELDKPGSGFLGLKSGAEYSAATNRLAEIKRDAEAIRQGSEQRGEPKPEPSKREQEGEKVQVLPLPSKKEDLVKGNVYNTVRGPAMWNGEKFQQ